MLGVLVGGALAWAVVRQLGDRGHVWLGVWLYALGAILAITLGRGGAKSLGNIVIDFNGVNHLSRYASLSGLFWVSIAAMAILVSRRVTVVLLVIALASVATTLAGQRYVVQSRDITTSQDRIAVLQYIGKADGAKPYFLLPLPALTDRMKRIRHYPFDGRFHNDCGLFGQRIDVGRVRPIADADADGRVETVKRDLFAGGAVAMDAWAEPIERVRCVVVTDRDGRVVGTGITGTATPEQASSSNHELARDAGISALAVDGHEGYQLLVSFERGGPLYRLPSAAAVAAKPL